jgi:hypothetical protein
LIGSEFQLCKPNNVGVFGHRRKVQNSLLISTTTDQLIELTFDVNKDSQALFRWTRGMIDALDCANKNVDRLTRYWDSKVQANFASVY